MSQGSNFDEELGGLESFEPVSLSPTDATTTNGVLGLGANGTSSLGFDLQRLHDLYSITPLNTTGAAGSCSSGPWYTGSSSIGQINWPNTTPNITVTPNTSPWVVNDSAINWRNPSVNTTITQSGTIELQGEKADIKINGVSLTEQLKAIQDRLNILVPNTKLESDWEELRELGNQYRQLEQKIKDQVDVWERLKSMPKPDFKV